MLHPDLLRLLGPYLRGHVLKRLQRTAIPFFNFFSVADADPDRKAIAKRKPKLPTNCKIPPIGIFFVLQKIFSYYRAHGIADPGQNYVRSLPVNAVG